MEKNTTLPSGEIVMLPVNQLFPHPDNPRKNLGDLTELSASIAESGILQNLTVIEGRYLTSEEWDEMENNNALMAERAGNEYTKLQYDPHNPIADGYTVVIGHRRLAASELAGLTELPCRITQMDYRTQIATMMAENVQRTDLTPFEQANGFQMMMDLGMSIDEVSEKTGFSKTTVRNRLKLSKLNADKVTSTNYTLFDLERVANIKDGHERDRLMRHLGTDDFSRNISDAERYQRRADAKATVEKQLKKLAPKLKIVDSSSIGTMYSTYKQLKKTDEMDINAIVLPDIPADATVIGISLSWNCEKADIRFGKPREEEKKDKKPTPEQIRKEGIKTLMAEKLRSVNSTYEDRRISFLSEVDTAVIREHMADIMPIVATLSGESVYYSGYKVITEVFSLEHSDGYSVNAIEERREAFRKEPERALLVYAYAKAAPDGAGYYNHNKGAYNKNEKLDRAYEMLIACGYKTTEEEDEMRSGKGDMFTKSKYAELYDKQQEKDNEQAQG